MDMLGEVCIGAELRRTGDTGRLLADGSLQLVELAVPPCRTAWADPDLADAEAALRDQAAVAGLRRDRATGPDGGAVAYVVPAAGHALTTDEVRAMVPGRLRGVVQLAALPRLDSGLVDLDLLPSSNPRTLPRLPRRSRPN